MATADSSDRVTADEAAAALTTTYPRILMLLRDGVLEGTQEDGIWYVSRASLQCLVSHGGDTGERNTCRKSCGGNCGSHN
jgi:hypothetical protein